MANTRSFLALAGAVALAAAAVLGSWQPRAALAAQPVAYGEWNPGWQSGAGVNNSVITGRDADMGYKLQLIHWYADASEGYADYDHIMVDNALALGRTPLVSWNLPIGYSNTANLDEWANGMKATGKPIYIRLFWEFNDPECSSNGDFHVWPACGHTPAQLVQTWQFIVNRFRADGATNVKWVWNPDGTMGSQMYGDSNGSVGLAYPGDNYVDFRGFDTYGYDNQAEYEAENRQTGSSKPMLIGEFGDTDRNGGAAWINDLSTRLNNGSMPEVQDVVYFNDSEYALSQNQQTKGAIKGMLQTAAFTQATTPTPTPTPSPTPTPTPTPSPTPTSTPSPTPTPTPTPSSTPTPTPTSSPTPTPTPRPSPTRRPHSKVAFAQSISGAAYGVANVQTLSRKVSAGDLLVAFGGNDSCGMTISDSLGSRWTLRKSGKFDSSYGALDLWTAVAPASGSDTITLELSRCSTWSKLMIAEFRYASPGAVAFGYGTNPGARVLGASSRWSSTTGAGKGSSSTLHSAGPTNSDDGTFVGLLTGRPYSAAMAGYGFAVASNDGSSCAGEYKLSGVTNAQSATWNLSPGTDWNVAALELRPAD